MKREDIEKAAVGAIRENYACNGKYPCTERYYCIYGIGKNIAFDCNECGADEFNEGFIKGAEWCINSVWHDVSEAPQKKGYILVQTNGEKPIYTTWSINVVPTNWDETVERNNVVKWAYVEDLIPNTKE